MALKYATIAGEGRGIRSHTGLSKEEFEQLSAAFAREWEHYMRHYTWCGKERRRQSKGRVNSVLPTVDDKLLFILFFLKTNPLQQVLATTFGLDQPQASRWLELLRGRLLATLTKERVLPGRQAARLYRAVAGENRLLIDGTERPVGRSVDEQTQQEYYSGKKKPHRQKRAAGLTRQENPVSEPDL
jgi:hypothetical protein